jgi:hypothetical protein
MRSLHLTDPTLDPGALLRVGELLPRRPHHPRALPPPKPSAPRRALRTRSKNLSDMVQRILARSQGEHAEDSWEDSPEREPAVLVVAERADDEDDEEAALRRAKERPDQAFDR